MNLRTLNDKLELLHSKLEAITALSTPFQEDHLNLHALIKDIDKYLDASKSTHEVIQ